MKKIVLFFTLFFGVQLTYSQVNSPFQERTLVLKVKSQFRSNCTVSSISYPGLSQIFDKLKIQSLAKMFPNAAAVREGSTRNGIPYSDISLIYKLKYNEALSLSKAIQVLMNTGIFEYVEPLAIQQALGVPNDPNAGSQWHLAKIKAYEAWDVTKGDTNIVVGMVDTGIDYGHNDVAPNIKFNYADPIDGNDNDGDGYIDNFRGWDMVGNDNDATHDVGGGTLYHGTWTSTSVGEVVDNNLQGAGVGYDTKFLPIKVSNSSGSIVAGYEGIVYAADHGCSIINASWGDTLGYTQYGQDVVNYATINKNALVIAAAGNNNNSSLFYPASLDKVISVGGSDTIDRKWVFSNTPGVGNGSNYNEFVDLLAPSMVIYACTSGNTFNKIGGGTSFAAPMVAAAAALAKKMYPSYTALQLGELVKNSVDKIDGIPFNATYSGKLGTGRLNVNNVLTLSGFPGFRLENALLSDGGNNVFVSGDTLKISGLVTNYLSASTNAIISISSSSAYLTPLNNSANLGAIGTFGSANVSGNSLTFLINGTIPNNTSAIVVVTFTDGVYSESQAFKILLNPSFLNMDINNITLSVGNDARLAYMGANQVNGSGFTYKGGASYLYSMGLVVTDKTKNASYSDFGDFASVENTSIIMPGIESDKDFTGIVNDNPAGGSKIGIQVKHKTLGWNRNGMKDFVIQEYKIINTSGGNLDSVYVGLYADWDVVNYAQNIADFDTTNKIAFAYDATSTYVGTKSLTGKYNVSHYAFNNDGSSGSFNMYNAGLTDAIAHASLSNGNARAIAGIADISSMIGEGPFNISAGDSITVAFALMYGRSQNDLINSGSIADSMYTTIRSITVDTIISVVKCKSGSDGSVALTPIYGVAPFKYQWNDVSNQTSATALNLTAGTYTCVITDKVYNKTNVIVNVVEPSSLLDLTTVDSTAVNGNCNGSATVSASGGMPGYTYLWNDNLLQTTSIASNLCANQYTVLVTDTWGCKDSVKVIVEDVTAVNDLKVNVKVIPNPASENAVIFIEALDENVLSVGIYDAAGRLVHDYQHSSQSNSSSHALNVDELSSGTYFIKVSNASSSSYYKLVVTH